MLQWHKKKAKHEQEEEREKTVFHQRKPEKLTRGEAKRKRVIRQAMLER
jgi:hypothetical protein